MNDEQPRVCIFQMFGGDIRITGEGGVQVPNMLLKGNFLAMCADVIPLGQETSLLIFPFTVYVDESNPPVAYG